MSQFDTVSISTCSLVELGARQTAVNVRLATKGEIARVLTFSAEATVKDYVVSKGQIDISGRCVYRLCVVDANGDIVGLNYNADYMEVVTDERLIADSKAYVNCEVVDSDYTVEGSTITINTLVQSKVYALCCTQTNCVTPCDQLECRLINATTVTSANIVQLKTNLIEQLELSQGITKVLCASACLTVDEYIFYENVLSIRGKGSVEVAYLTQDNALRVEMVPYMYAEEIATEVCDNATLLYSSARNVKIHMDLSADEQNKMLSVEITAEFVFACTSTDSMQVVADAYSLTNDIALQRITLTNAVFAQDAQENFSLTSLVPVEALDEVLAIGNLRAKESTATMIGQQLEIEGVLSGTLIGKREEQLQGENFEIPFSVSLPYAVEGGQPICCLKVCKCNYKQTAKGCELTWEAVAHTNSITTTTGEAVSEIVIGEPIARADCAFEVVMARANDGLWEVSKSMNMKAEEIVATNPELTFPLENDEQIILYHKL